MSPPGGETAHPEPVSRELEIGTANRKRKRSRGTGATRSTIRAINVNADVRREARDGTQVAGWRARCTCGWNQLRPDAADARKAWESHYKRFENDRHAPLRALPELGERDRKPHANAVEKLTGDLEVLFDDRRVETAGTLRVAYYGATAHYREDR